MKLFDEPIFTLWLAAYGIGSIDEPAGGLSFGSRDPENCQSDAKFIPLISESIWAIQVDAVGTSGQPKNSQKQTVGFLFVYIGVCCSSAVLLLNYIETHKNTA